MNKLKIIKTNVEQLVFIIEKLIDLLKKAVTASSTNNLNNHLDIPILIININT
jgi:hypothetical protein